MVAPHWVGGQVELFLRWKDLEFPATIDADGDLRFLCPWCMNRIALQPHAFKIEGQEVRSTGIVTCRVDECGVWYEIVHGRFVLWEPLGCDMWLRHRQWYAPQLIHPVWKTRNERRKR